MIAIRSATEIRDRMSAVKAVGKGFATNFFLRDEAIEKTISDGAWSAFESDGAVIFLRREADFGRLYYGAADVDYLSRALSQLARLPFGITVVDVVGREQDVSRWVDPFVDAGFSGYDRFLRMQRVFANQLSAQNADESVEVAREPDAEAILEAIAGEFDAYSEHIPTVEEIRQAILARTILVVRDHSRLAAVLYYDRSGLTTVFRYWIVRPAYRSTGAGDRLIRRYFSNCADCKLSLLWVKETNIRARQIYRWYGYSADSLVDAVLMKRQ